MVQLQQKSLAVPQKVKQSYQLTQLVYSQVSTQKNGKCMSTQLTPECSSEALLITAKGWNPKCPSTGKRVNKLLSTDSGLSFSRKKGVKCDIPQYRRILAKTTDSMIPFL